jgi:hypothetical protein
MPDLDICRHEFSETEIPFYFAGFTTDEDIEDENASICVFSFTANRKTFKQKFLDALYSDGTILSVIDQFAENNYNKKDTLCNITFTKITEDNYKMCLEELQNATNIEDDCNE